MPRTATVETETERVELESLPPDANVMLGIALPAGLKLALKRMAESHQLSVSAYARDLLARHAEYTIPASFDQRTRKHKYANEEERKEAMKQRARAEREKVKRLLALLESGAIQLPE